MDNTGLDASGGNVQQRRLLIYWLALTLVLVCPLGIVLQPLFVRLLHGRELPLNFGSSVLLPLEVLNVLVILLLLRARRAGTLRRAALSIFSLVTLAVFYVGFSLLLSQPILPYASVLPPPAVNGARIVYECPLGALQVGLYGPSYHLNEICAISADGSGHARLTYSYTSNYTPQLTPDGKQIVFIRGPQDFIMNADGTELRGLSGVERNALFPKPSTEVADCKDDASRYFRVFSSSRTIGSSSGTVSRAMICSYLHAKLLLPTESPFGNFTNLIMLAWSPDSSHLTFVKEGIVYVTLADGSTETVLGAATDCPAYWTVDGKHVVFTYQGSIYVAHSNGSNRRRLAERGGAC